MKFSLQQFIGAALMALVIGAYSGWMIRGQQPKPRTIVTFTPTGGPVDVDFTKLTKNVIIEGDGFRIDACGLTLWSPEYEPPPCP